jgi:hypothetical protein
MAHKTTTSKNDTTESLNYESPILEHKKCGFINEFLWTCAGVNKAVLRQCPTDYAKYAGIGGTIFFTAVMAAISGSYAISSVFQDAPIYVPILFGVIWGLMIFNLDRFMVNTMYSDGKHTISIDEIKGGLPRIILAIFLGIVISTPLEIRIFKDKIESQLIINQGKVGDEIRVANDLLYQQRKDLEEKIADKRSVLNELQTGRIPGNSSIIAQKEKELSEAEDRLYNETNGTGVTGKMGYGPAAKQLQDKVDRLKYELARLRSVEQQNIEDNKTFIEEQKISINNDINDYRRQLNDLNNKISQVEKDGQKSQKALTGFCAQFKALGEITPWPWHSKEDNDSLFYARFFITLLFILIEVIPTLFKMMMEDGPYDDLLRAEMHRVKVLSEKQISDINDEVNTCVRISTMKNEKRLEAETLANEDIMRRIALVQSELLQKAISDWKEEEMKKINENPSAYIKLDHTESTKQS